MDLAGTASTRPRRIALLGYRSHPYAGGQGIYLRYLSRALAECGHRVDIISGPPYPQLDPRVRLVKMPGMDLYRTGLASLRPQHLRSAANTLEWLSKLSGGFAEPQAFGMRVLEFLRHRRHDYDLVHDNQSLSYAMLRLQRLGVPLVTTIHHPISSDLRLALAAEPSLRRRLLIRRWHSFLSMQRRVARRLDHLVTVSARSRDDIAGDFGIDPCKIKVIPNGVDTSVFVPQPTVRRANNLLITTASADQALKGLRYLLEAVHQLSARFPALELLVIGKIAEDGPTGPLIDRLGLRRRVRFLSGIATEELVEHYARATLAVCPSLYEGFGLPAAEAMACGIPLVCSDGGALPEVTGDAALTVPAGNARALAEAIAMLLEQPDLRLRLGQRGRQRITERFCWRQTALGMSHYYEQVLDANG